MKTDALTYPKVNAGYYAVPDGFGVLKFYQIQKPTPPSKWAGWLFLKVQASDDFYPVKNEGERSRVFYVINQDHRATLQRYGQAIGKCGHCGRKLTDATSRELGIGPVCRQEVGL